MEFVKQYAEIIKVDTSRRLVFGWAITCTVDGAPYYDLTKSEEADGDYITEDSMLDAVSDFMIQSRIAKEMHKGEKVGSVVHSMPMTADIAKSFGVATNKTGWMVGVFVEDDETLAKFASGELKGFSIGGSLEKHEVVNA